MTNILAIIQKWKQRIKDLKLREKHVSQKTWEGVMKMLFDTKKRRHSEAVKNQFLIDNKLDLENFILQDLEEAELEIIFNIKNKIENKILSVYSVDGNEILKIPSFYVQAIQYTGNYAEIADTWIIKFINNQCHIQFGKGGRDLFKYGIRLNESQELWNDKRNSSKFISIVDNMETHQFKFYVGGLMQAQWNALRMGIENPSIHNRSYIQYICDSINKLPSSELPPPRD